MIRLTNPKPLALTAALVVVATLAGCSGTSTSSPPPPSASSTPSIGTPTQQAQGQGLSAKAAFERIKAKVPTAKLTVVYTAETDENHLLGRPHGYTSKVAFADSRVSKADIVGTEVGDTDRGGGIEAFANAKDAQSRQTYLESFSGSILNEYDYRNGSVLVRVSGYLTPAQASSYKAAAATLNR